MTPYILMCSEGWNLTVVHVVSHFFSTGLGVNAHLLYIGECSPKNLRGLLTLTPSIFIGLGKVIGQVIGIK